MPIRRQASFSDAVGVAGFVIGVPGLLALFFGTPHALRTGDVLALVLVPIAAGIGWEVHLRRRHRAVPLKLTSVFRPFHALAPGEVWRRPREAQAITDAIIQHARRARDLDDDAPALALPLVVGASGAGKSTLLNVIVPHRLGETAFGARLPAQLHYRVFREYFDGLRGLELAISEAPPDSHGVYVLDQFERWLAALRTAAPADRRRAQAHLRTLLERHARECTVVIGVRSEWYYDLRFLDEYLPPAGAVCSVDGEDVEYLAEIRSAFLEIGTRVEDVDRIVESLRLRGDASPLRAQIVGAVLEWRHGRLDAEPAEANLDGLVEAYFAAVLEGANDPEACSKIVCALSAETRFRDQMTRAKIRDVVFETDNVVDDHIAYLSGGQEPGGVRLIVSEGAGLDVAHDFVAEYFRNDSGSRLNPVDRDSVFYLAQYGPRKDVFVDERDRRPRLGALVGALVLGFMVLRLCGFGIAWNQHQLGPTASHLVFGGRAVDAVYLPGFVAQAGWLLYVVLLYDGLLRDLQEGWCGHLASYGVLLGPIVAAVMVALGPSMWLLSIAVGGSPAGLRLLMLSRRPDLNRTAQRHLGVWARMNLSLATFLALLGAAQWYIGVHSIGVSDAGDLDLWLSINVVAALLVCISCTFLAPIHVGASSLSQIKGLMARRRRS